MSGVADDDRPQAADDAVGSLWTEATGQTNAAPALAMLDPRQVVVPERLRPEDPAHTAALIESVRAHGVRLPIEVRMLDGRPVLIAGLHRVRAAIAAGRKTVPAIIRQASDDQAELLEIEENLIRHDLNALDRAVFVARWKEVYQRPHPSEGKRGRKLRQVGAIAFSRSAEAKKIGLSKRSIEREARRVSLIAPDVRPLLAGTDAAPKGTMLDALGRWTTTRSSLWWRGIGPARRAASRRRCGTRMRGTCIARRWRGGWAWLRSRSARCARVSGGGVMGVMPPEPDDDAARLA